MRLWIAAAFVAATTTALGAEVDVLSAGAAEAPFHAAAAAWQGKSGNKVKATFGPVGELRKRIDAGERPDLMIVPSEAIEGLAKAGAIDPATRHDVGTVVIGAAVREGAPRPDISTPEALKRALTQAKSVTYMDPTRGTSGKHFDEQVLPALGIRDAVRAKAVLGEGGFIAEKVAKGEVEIAFHNVTEIMPVAGVTLAGLLPAELQKPTTYSGAVLKSAGDPAAAQSLLDYLASPAGRKSFLDRGFTAPQ